jgi:hypothetical protein
MIGYHKFSIGKPFVGKGKETMRKPLFVCACILLLVSISCQFLLPQSAPQPQNTPLAATIPPQQAKPTREQLPISTATFHPAPTTPLSTATPPPAPNTLVLLEDLPLMFWNVKVSYDPAIWEPGSPQTPPSLMHRSLSTCKLNEQGPTEPPQADRKVTLGPVTYMVAEMVSGGNPIHWYMAVKGPQGPFADGIPTLVVSSSPEQLEPCRTSAEEVLATLR